MRGYEKYGDFLNEQGRYLDADFNYNKAIENGLANTGFQNDWIVYPRIQAAKAKNFCDMGKIEDGLVLIEKVINKAKNDLSSENKMRKAILNGIDPKEAYLKYGKF